MINVRDIAKIEQKRRDLRKEIYTKYSNNFLERLNSVSNSIKSMPP